MRPYEPGDDVRRIEWNVTARTGVPHVRVELAERVLVTWLVLDALGVDGVRHRRPPQGGRRRRRRRRGRLRGDAPRQPARHGRVRQPSQPSSRRGRGGAPCCEALRLLRELPPGGSGTLRDALELTDRVARQRALVVVVSDFRGPLDWRAPLLRLAGRHTVLAVEVRDPREQELADVGELRLVDPETGRQLRVDTGDRAPARAIRRRPRARSAARSLRASRRPASRHVALSTEGDWLRPLAAFLRQRQANR